MRKISVNFLAITYMKCLAHWHLHLKMFITLARTEISIPSYMASTTVGPNFHLQCKPQTIKIA